MWLYLLIFLIPILFYIISLRTENYRSTVELAVFLSGLAIFVGLSDMLGGYDRYIYGQVFDEIADVTDYYGNYIQSGSFEAFPSEKGWTILNILISFYTDNRYIFILSITLLTYVFLFISLRRYASNYPFALILFLGLWFYFTFTYLRQVLGATLVWLSIPYIIKRRFIPFCIISLVALSIHKSAIIFFPTYFIVNRSFTRKQILYAMALALVLGISPIPNALFNAYGDMSQVEMRADYSASSSFRIEYFLEACFFLWLILRNYVDPIESEDNSDTEPIEISEEEMQKRVMSNLAFIFCALLLFFIRSENGGRMAWYYVIGIICTLTDIANTELNKKVLAPLLIVVSLFLYMRIYVSWQVGYSLYPYKTFLTDGYRENDPVRNQYEYDYNYDRNKFYRDAFRIKVNRGNND